MSRLSSSDHEAREQRLRAVTAENALVEALAHVADLHAQIDRANAAAVRLAQGNAPRLRRAA